MPLFQYQALNQLREDVTGEITAQSAEEALARLRDQGLFPTSLKHKGISRPQRQAAEPPPALRQSAGAGWFGASLKQLIYFTRQFSAMQDAGLPILRTLQVLQQQQKPGVLRNALREMVQDIQDGSNLAEAMSKHPKIFDQLYVKIVAAGETGGLLEPMLNRIAATLERSLDLRRKIIKAMVYPCFVLFFALLILIFIMAVIVPMIINTINEAGVDMVGPITILDRISRWFTGGIIPGWFIHLVLHFLIWLAFRVLRTMEPVRYVLDSIKLKIPLFGMLARKTAISRFSRMTGMLIGAGIPIVEALETARQTAGNRVFARLLGDVEDAVRDGQTLAKPLQATRFVDLTVINMVEVGEETGDLDKMLIKVADMYDEDVETMVNYMTSLLGPALLIFVALLVGIIVVIVFLTVFGITTGGL